MVRAITRLRICILALAGTMGACTDQYVTRPDSSHQAPTFTIGNNVLNNSFAVDQSVSTASGTVNAKGFTEILLTVTAANPVSGVKSLDLVVSRPQPFGPVYTVHMDGTPLANGDVPIFLRALGTDGAGGNGNTPLRLFMLSPATLTATATSFDGTSSTITIDYHPWGDVAATLQASPTPIPIGSSSTLTWTTSFAKSVTVGPGITPPWGLADSLSVTPPATTTYVLTATNPFGSTQALAKVTVTNTGSLTVTYRGEAATAQANPTITMTGHYTGLAAASAGASDFTRELHPTFAGNQPWVIAETFNNLVPGSWLVKVDAEGRGTFTCPATVIGAITLRDVQPVCQ